MPSQLNFNEIIKPIADDLSAVEKILLAETTIQYDFVDHAVRHVVEGGGKRLRPILTVLSAKACDHHDTDAHQLAACVELIHVASLVHDDVLDEAPIRRGQTTLHSIWGNKVAVLVGDYLHARVLSMLVSRKTDDPAMAILADAAQAMCEGEVIHAYKSGDFEISLDDYLKIIGLKTGRLISASCEIGAILGTKDPKKIQALIDYGNAIGNAFQIIDDLLDFVADPEKFGKRQFNDLREGKLTFPTIHVRDRCTADEREKLERVFDTEFDEIKMIEWIEKLIEKYNVCEKCLDVAQNYANHAKTVLLGLPPSSARSALSDLADILVSREN